ncbi:MAG TPA: stalk domain-containing protein [Syntrophomonadaceae bacterium]|nr:stalk domain-containing protein [Syntrophomonadaceae bacterium]HPU47960.1 stalk domain-containing protein [Syntrophomonadaceae bacterium]
MKTQWRKWSLLAVLIILLLVQPGQAAEIVEVEMNGLPVEFDTPAVISNDRVMVPFRGLAELLDVQVEWLADSQTVMAVAPGTQIKLQVGNPIAYHNQEPVFLDAPPMLTQGRVLVPLRFFSEAFGCQVTWNPEGRQVQLVSPPVKMEVLGYYALGDKTSSSWEDLFGKPYPDHDRGHTDLVSCLALGWFSLDEAGNLLTTSRTGWQRPDGWEDVLTVSRSRGLNNEMTIHMVNGQGEITALLNDDKACRRAVEEISREARYYDGVNLDLEGLGLSASGSELLEIREKYTAFVTMLVQRLHQEGKTVSLSLHPPNSSYRGYDYAALGKVCDRLVIMAYDYGPKPEPLEKVREAVEMTLAQVPAQKVLLGISVPAENPASLTEKVELARRYHLQGIALWRLGLLDDPMWQSLSYRIVAR